MISAFKYLYKNDLFLYPAETLLTDYADENTLYSIRNTTGNIKNALSHDFRSIGNCFYENLMVLNAVTRLSELVVKTMTLYSK